MTMLNGQDGLKHTTPKEQKGARKRMSFSCPLAVHGRADFTKNSLAQHWAQDWARDWRALALTQVHHKKIRPARWVRF